MKKNSENAKFGWKKIRIKWNLVLCNRNICGLLEHQSKGKKSIYLAATVFFRVIFMQFQQLTLCIWSCWLILENYGVYFLENTVNYVHWSHLSSEQVALEAGWEMEHYCWWLLSSGSENNTHRNTSGRIRLLLSQYCFRCRRFSIYYMT